MGSVIEAGLWFFISTRRIPFIFVYNIGFRKPFVSVVSFCVLHERGDEESRSIHSTTVVGKEQVDIMSEKVCLVNPCLYNNSKLYGKQ